MRPPVLLVLSLPLLFACGAPELPDELVAPSAERLTERSEAVGLMLAPADAECASRRLDETTATALVAPDELDDAVARTLSVAVIECAGTDTIARSALTPFTGGASESSVDCAADRLDQRLLEDLVAGQLASDPVPKAEVELAVVTAVSLCLELDELRGRG